MRRSLRQRWRAAIVALLAPFLLALPGVARAQSLGCQAGEPEVRKLTFRGNAALSDGDLSQVIATTTSSLARRIFRYWVGQERCLDRDELARDIARLKLYYRQRGYWEAQVDTQVTPRGKRGVNVAFDIVEGPPIRLTSLRITGLDSVVNREAILGGLDTSVGGPYDEIRLTTLADTIGSRLLDNGYPGARISVGHDVATDTRTASYYINVDPGHLTRIAGVRVVVDSTHGAQKIRSRTVNKILGLRPGQIYRRKDLIRAQRNLYATDAYRHVELGLAPGQSAEDSLLLVQASLIEGDMRSMQTGVGWGTLDCFRTQATYGDRNFLGGARRLDVTGRVSKLGIAAPTKSDWVGHALCPAARGDTIGTAKLNYYTGATYRQPTFFGLRARSVPSFTLYSERRSEFKQYVRSTPIGFLASVTREQWNRAPLTFGYQIERGRTQAAPAFFCALFQICQDTVRARIADKTLRLAVASVALTVDRTDQPLSPTTGGIVRFELRHASRLIGSSEAMQFNKGIADGSVFTPLGENAVLALRLRAGAVDPFNPSLRSVDLAHNFIPPQERLYAGGSNTVRGVQQNELGPLVYIADRRFVTVTNVDANTRTFEAHAVNGVDIASKGYNFIPTGGDRLIVANAEVRFRDPLFPNLLQWTVFTDAGNVWESRNTKIAKQSLRVTPGIGLSVLTFLGPIGMTAGYNPKQRPAGQLYYNDLYAANVNESETPNVSNLTVCLPPSGVATVTRVNGVWSQSSSECSASAFRPNKRTALRDRIVLLFTIGQAF